MCGRGVAGNMFEKWIFVHWTMLRAPCVRHGRFCDLLKIEAKMASNSIERERDRETEGVSGVKMSLFLIFCRPNKVKREGEDTHTHSPLFVVALASYWRILKWREHNTTRTFFILTLCRRVFGDGESRVNVLNWFSPMNNNGVNKWTAEAWSLRRDVQHHFYNAKKCDFSNSARMNEWRRA